ncbi:Tetratricopeptide-like helical domain superfamily [Sesbania bispinosa]|nr:Tetratricopeptide-like helical domain superfamily [Sesbania bispinosa]
MGKSLESVARLQELSRVVSSAKPHRSKGTQPRSANRVATPRTVVQPCGAVKVDSAKKMEALEGEQCRTPLSKVVADCAKRWFQETLKEAKAGDIAMQVLVGQMFYSGYGVRRNPEMGHAWISKASKSRSSVWKVSDKRPGYRASDSDSCEPENK